MSSDGVEEEDEDYDEDGGGRAPLFEFGSGTIRFGTVRDGDSGPAPPLAEWRPVLATLPPHLEPQRYKWALPNNVARLRERGGIGAAAGDWAVRHRLALQPLFCWGDRRELRREDWAAVDQLQYDIFWQHLRIAPEESAVVVIEPSLADQSAREALVSQLFTRHNPVEACLLRPAVAALHGAKRTTGVVVDCGAGMTRVTPLINGAVIAAGVRSLRFAGHDVTARLQQLLVAQVGHALAQDRPADCCADLERLVAFSSASDPELVREFKESPAFVGVSPTGRECDPASSTGLSTVVLPDGEPISVPCHALYACAEPLFAADTGVSAMVRQAIAACAEEHHAILWSNIVVCGGTSLLQGFVTRLEHELAVSVVAPDHRRLLAWHGAQLMCSANQVRWLKSKYYIPNNARGAQVAAAAACE